MNPLEEQYLSLLGDIGVADVGGEPDPKVVNLVGNYEGRVIRLFAAPEPIGWITGARLVGTTEIAGRHVEVWDVRAGGEVVRVTCGDEHVELASMLPGDSRSSTLEAVTPFVEAVLARCAPED